MAAETSADDLIRRLVGPYVVPERDARREALVARVDALSGAMRRVPSPDFQAAEALARPGVPGAPARDGRAHANRASMSPQRNLPRTSRPLMRSKDRRCTLCSSSSRRSTLTRVHFPDRRTVRFRSCTTSCGSARARSTDPAAAGAPFIAGLDPQVYRPHQRLAPLTRQAGGAAWPAAAAYLASLRPSFCCVILMVSARILSSFAFEEFTREDGLQGMLWGSAALLPVCLIAQNWLRNGNSMTLGSLATIGELPVFVYEDTDSEQIALPCTNRLLTERQAVQVASCGAMPLVSLRGRGEVRVASFGSRLADTPLADAGACRRATSC